jgi:hypothetical protein
MRGGGVPGFDGGDSRDDQGRDPVSPPPAERAIQCESSKSQQAGGGPDAAKGAVTCTADWPGRCRSALNRQINVTDPMTSARTPRPTANHGTGVLGQSGGVVLTQQTGRHRFVSSRPQLPLHQVPVPADIPARLLVADPCAYPGRFWVAA